jgi:predicted YcjX-like family ATPase
MTDAVALAELRARELPNAVLLDQFTSAAIPRFTGERPLRRLERNRWRVSTRSPASASASSQRY